MKKIILASILLIVGIIIGGGILMAYKDDQVVMQFKKEVVSIGKRDLDFTPFEGGLEELTTERLSELDQMIFEKTLDEVQSSIDAGHMTVEELVLYHVYRIKKYSEYNVMIQMNPKALEQAKALDMKIKSGEKLGALYGSTVLLKDNIAALDMNVASGTYALKDTSSKRDAFLVSILKNEDSIVLGKANLSEWSNFMSEPSSNGFSVLGGQTKNPYGQYDVGGSSSGPSAGVAMNLATYSIGSETCGSLIYPAGQNSIVTLKPTTGLISRDLIIPITEAQDTAGVMTRNVADLNKVFETLLVKDQNDPKSNVLDDLKVDNTLNKNYLKGKSFGVLDTESEKMKQIIDEFKSAGAEIVQITLPSVEEDIDMLSVLLYGIEEDVNDFLNHSDIDAKYKSLEDIVAFYKANPEFMPYGQHYLEEGLALTLSESDYEALVEKNEAITKKVLDDALNSHNLSGILSISNDLSLLYAIAGYPAVALPGGYEDSGEPYCLTIVGGYNDDFNLIKAAYAYEQNNQKRKLPNLK